MTQEEAQEIARDRFFATMGIEEGPEIEIGPEEILELRIRGEVVGVRLDRRLVRRFQSDEAADRWRRRFGLDLVEDLGPDDRWTRLARMRPRRSRHVVRKGTGDETTDGLSWIWGQPERGNGGP